MDEMRFRPAWRDRRLMPNPGITGLWQIQRTQPIVFSRLDSSRPGIREETVAVAGREDPAPYRWCGLERNGRVLIPRHRSPESTVLPGGSGASGATLEAAEAAARGS